MKFHAFAEIFPLLEGAAFDELVVDIKEFGLREPIWTYGGKVLDGRNRYLACQKAKVPPKTREFRGTEADALALVVSSNLHRRQLTVAQKAFAGARIAELRRGDNQHTARAASSVNQSEIAGKLGTSPDSIQRARKVLENGSKALQRAAESGDVPLKRAAAVTSLPKSEQLAAAKEKPEADEPERPEWEPSEDERLAAIEVEVEQSVERILKADDRLAAAHAEIKRQAAEIAVLKAARDHYQNETGAAVRVVKARDREIEKLRRALAKAKQENDALLERIAIMEAT